MREYFVRALTSSGEVNLSEENFRDIKNVYSVKGGTKTEKTKIFRTLAKYFDERGAELILSPFGKGEADGIVLGDFAAVDFSVYGKGEILSLPEAEMKKELSDKQNAALSELFGAFREAKKIHDGWEQVYIKNMDTASLNRFTEFTLGCLIREKGNGEGKRTGRFFGASRPDGAISLIPSLTEGLKKRYFIKGRPGTGKSTFLKKLAERAESFGYDTEVYYCSFDKNSLDMVIVPTLSFAVFDSTFPHEHFPESERDTVLDFYQEARLSGIDERYENELSSFSRRYSLATARGRSALALAESCFYEAEYYAKTSEDAANKLILELKGLTTD